MHVVRNIQTMILLLCMYVFINHILSRSTSVPYLLVWNQGVMLIKQQA